jgi:hypothetical protein
MQALSCAAVYALWQRDDAFRAFFTALLAEAPFAVFRWETPCVSTASLQRDFEFVLLNSPGLAHTADEEAFAEHFVTHEEHAGIVVFDSLGRDATLIAPSPRSPTTSYAHLAGFLRTASAAQTHALWRVVGATIQAKISPRPLWLSTAGGGVAWLHVRLDTRPKYYGHEPYRAIA